MTTLAVESPSLKTAVTGMRPRWPASARRRWALRLALSLPYVVVVLVADLRDITSAPNTLVADGADSIAWGSDDLSFVADTYPPLPTAIAALLPGGALAIGIAGAVCAGIVMQVLVERLHVRLIETWQAVLFVASVGVTPAFVYASTQDFAMFLGIALLALALAGMLRFAVDGDTEGGFQCGLALGVAAMCDPATAVFAAFIALGGPLVAWQRYRGTAGSVVATLSVLLFPTAAAFLGWAFLEWRFAGSAFETLRESAAFLDFSDGVLAALGDAAADVVVTVLLSPVFVIAAVLLARRRPVAALAQILVLCSLVLVQWLGLSGGPEQSIVIIASVGVMTIPASPSRRATMALIVASVAQIAVSWVPLRPDLVSTEFVEVLFGG